MNEEHSRLGRGLGALIAPRPLRPPGFEAGADPVVGGTRYREVPVEALRPNARQPRTAFDDDTLAELVASIHEVGLLQPIVVREIEPQQFEIIMGERRWRAARAAGLARVPVLVRETADTAMLRDALLENLHRESLNPLDEGAAYAQLLDDFGATHDQLAARVGRSRAHVTNTIRLLNLPPVVQRRVAAGVLSAGHARAILALDDAGAQEQLAARVVAEGLSVRVVEELVAVGDAGEARRRERSWPRRTSGEHAAVAEALSERLETRVRVESGRSRGRIIVEFGSPQDLDRLVALLAPGDRDDPPSPFGGTGTGAGPALWPVGTEEAADAGDGLSEVVGMGQRDDPEVVRTRPVEAGALNNE